MDNHNHQEVLYSQSSAGEQGSPLALSMPINTIPLIKVYHSTDPEQQELSKRILSKPHQLKDYSVVNGLIKFKDRIFLKSSSFLIPQILKECHGFAIGGHSGILRTLKRISTVFWWPKMRQMCDMPTGETS